jgi:hypothetical protein
MECVEMMASDFSNVAWQMVPKASYYLCSKKKASYYFGKTIESIPICFSLLKLTKQEDAVVQCEACLNKLYRLT